MTTANNSKTLNKYLRHPIVLLLCLYTYSVQSMEIRSFTTDGCSAFLDGTPVKTDKWLDCCIRHDVAYWQGGSYAQRLNADLELEKCVVKAGEPEIAKIMLTGVRLGGSPFFPTPYRWGYGWPFPRGYQALTAEEKQQVNRKIKSFVNILDSSVQSTQ